MRSISEKEAYAEFFCLRGGGEVQTLVESLYTCTWMIMYS